MNEILFQLSNLSKPTVIENELAVSLSNWYFFSLAISILDLPLWMSEQIVSGEVLERIPREREILMLNFKTVGKSVFLFSFC